MLKILKVYPYRSTRIKNKDASSNVVVMPQSALQAVIDLIPRQYHDNHIVFSFQDTDALSANEVFHVALHDGFALVASSWDTELAKDEWDHGGYDVQA